MTVKRRVDDAFPVCRYQMGDFSGDVLREVSLPLLDKSGYNTTPVALSNCSRRKADVKMKVCVWDVCVPPPPTHTHTCFPSQFILLVCPQVQKKQECVREELAFDLLRPKKKNLRRDRLCPPQRRPGRPPGPYTVNQADIKQYDFHSSGEDDSPPPLVSSDIIMLAVTSPCLCL